MKNDDSIKEKSILDIKKELISKDLNELIKPLLLFMLLAITFGYGGYQYSVYNDIDIRHGIIFGSLCPLGLMIIKKFDYDRLSVIIIYLIAYICIVDYIPTFIGVIILFFIVGLFTMKFIYIEIKDRTEEIAKIVNNDSKQTSNTIQKRSKPLSKEEIANSFGPISYDISQDMFDEDKELEYECERCYKRISYEEHELNDWMCEDCYQEVHTDEHGNFHDDKCFIK